MYPLENRLTIIGRLEEVARACDFVAAIAHQIGMNEQDIHHCVLAIDETCTNIIEHGYKHDSSNNIEIVCQLIDNGLAISIRDEGPAFNPLARSDPDPKMHLEDRADGGWGIFFTKKIMDDVRYSRDGTYNQLTLIKYMSKQ